TRIEIEYIYRGARADGVRRELQFQSLTSYIEDRCALFSYIYGMNMCALPQMVDDRKLNEITITSIVTAENAWPRACIADEKVLLSPESGFDYVLDDPDGRRRYPFAIGDVREGRISTVIKTDYQLDLPMKARSWDFGGLQLGFTPRRTATGYEAVRHYRVLRGWLDPQEKVALDRAYDEISRYDRLSIKVAETSVVTWRQALTTRAAVWIVAAAAGAALWGLAMLKL